MKRFSYGILFLFLATVPVHHVQASTEGPPTKLSVEKVFPRTEIPWTSLSMAVPRLNVHASLLPLVAALIMEPTAWSEGHIRQLLEYGGHFDATAHPDGIVITAEGPSHNWDLLWSALHEPLSRLSSDVFAFSRAQGRVLRMNTENRGNFHHLARARLWEIWFGQDVPPRAIELDDLQMHQISINTVHDAWDSMAAGNHIGLFLEGRLPVAYTQQEGNHLDAGVPALQSETKRKPDHQTAPRSEASPHSKSTDPMQVQPIPLGPPSVLRIPGPSSHLVLGHPLPRTMTRNAEDQWLLAAEIQAQLSDFGEVSVDIDSYADASLLIIDIKTDPNEDLELLSDHIEKSLLQGRPEMGSKKIYQTARTQHHRQEAKLLRQFGEQARRSAVCHLKHCVPESEEPDAAAQKTRLRALLFPEIFRHVILQAGSPLPRPEPYGPKQK
jgi:hypothetical protein